MGMLAASRGGAILAQFAAQLAVGTLAGASGLGVLQLFTSWTCIAGEVLGLGLPTRAMRQVSVAYAAGQADGGGGDGVAAVGLAERGGSVPQRQPADSDRGPASRDASRETRLGPKSL